MQVILKDLRFFCYHGLHDEEALTGGEFLVNVVAMYEPKQVPVVSINETVDYAKMFELVQERMMQRTLLLETLATEIASKILEAFSLVSHVRVSISKLHPPIVQLQGSVEVSFELKRST